MKRVVLNGWIAGRTCGLWGQPNSKQRTKQFRFYGIVSADSILLVSCILDEAFDGQWFYPMFSDSIDLQGIKEIHLIPSYNVGDDSSTAVPYMIGIAQIDYVFYQTEFESFSGKVMCLLRWI
jgi:hypothetical protein